MADATQILASTIVVDPVRVALRVTTEVVTGALKTIAAVEDIAEPVLHRADMVVDASGHLLSGVAGTAVRWTEGTKVKGTIRALTSVGKPIVNGSVAAATGLANGMAKAGRGIAKAGGGIAKAGEALGDELHKVMPCGPGWHLCGNTCKAKWKRC
jgi:hypothetical protein